MKQPVKNGKVNKPWKKSAQMSGGLLFVAGVVVFGLAAYTIPSISNPASSLLGAVGAYNAAYDYNNDGRIGAADALYLLKLSLASGTTCPAAKICDLDASGKITDADAQKLIDMIIAGTIPAPASPLKLASPNGGEQWTTNSTQRIVWTGGDPSWYMNIYIDNTVKATSTLIASRIPNKGAFDWKIPSNMPSSTYVARIVCSGCVSSTTSAYDISDGKFTIVADVATTSPIIVTPIGASVSVNAGQNANDDMGTFTIKYTVTAGNSDIYIPMKVNVGLPGNVPMTSTVVVDRAGVATTSGSTALMTSGTLVPNTAGNYVVKMGTNATFQITTTVQLPYAGTAGQYRVSLLGVKYGTNEASINQVFNTGGIAGFSTAYYGLN